MDLQLRKGTRMRLTIVVPFVVGALVHLHAAEGPIVATRAGRVQGLPGAVVVFKGIPFARPPVGDLRWKAPTPVESWSGVRSATEFGPACMQKRDRRMSEDCLYLNVWTPAAALEEGNAAPGLPAMIWVHGGSFTQGSGDIDGSALAQKGVTVVSFNYRVGTFGFLAHPQLSAESPQRASGNYGLMDTVAALRWVRENIRRFGGDPDRVTLWGVSAGASAISALMVSPIANGLFHQVILESPGAMRHWKSLKEAEQQGLSVGRDISALRKLSTSEIPLILNMGGGAEVRPLFEPRVMGPVLDGFVLKEEEREAFEAGRVNEIRAILVGNNTDEGAIFTRGYPVKTVAEYGEYLNRPQVFGRFGREALSHYPVSSDADVPRAIADSFSDSQFNFGVRGIARAMIVKTPQVYRYRFTRKSNDGTGHDAWHGAEVPYVMGDINRREYNEDDRNLSNIMMDAWVRFAATGDPNGGTITNWPAYDAISERYLVLDVHPTVTSGFRDDQLNFIGKVQRATHK